MVYFRYQVLYQDNRNIDILDTPISDTWSCDDRNIDISNTPIKYRYIEARV